MPGVPPDAANIVKRVFKGIFKRGKKDGKQNDTNSNSTSTPPPQQSQQSQPSSYGDGESPTPQIDTKPPQLPPLANASPLQSATEPSKAVPPTHPLATGEHGTGTRQEAVPASKDAETAPGPLIGTMSAGTFAAGAVSGGGLKAPEKLGASNATADVSPPVSTMEGATAADAPKSGAVSAVSEEQGRGQVDGVAEGTGTEPGMVGGDVVTAAEPSVPAPTTTTTTAMESTPTTMTETSEPAAPVARKENIPPQANGTAPINSTSSPTDTTAAPTTDSAPATTTTTADARPATDEKMPAVEEPPPIKAVRAAPGMSATSGPLEDFPEGGDAKDH